jgi:hypothetical protein
MLVGLSTGGRSGDGVGVGSISGLAYHMEVGLLGSDGVFASRDFEYGSYGTVKYFKAAAAMIDR